MSFARTLLIAFALLGLAACQNDSSPANSPLGEASAPAARTTAAASNAAISVDPAVMHICGNTVATVRWDADKLGVITTGTEVWVGTSDANFKLFSAGGATGEAKTGNWTSPGTHFQLRNKPDGKVLGEAVVGGPACP